MNQRKKKEQGKLGKKLERRNEEGGSGGVYEIGKEG